LSWRVGTRGIAALAFAVVLAAQPVSALAAGDTANCSEYGFVHRHMGYLSDAWSGHRYGVRAYFGAIPLDLCTNPRAGEGSTSVVWPAIQGPLTNPSHPFNIVQIGFGRCYPVGGPSGNCSSADRTADHDFWAYGYDNDSPGCNDGRLPLAPTGHWEVGLSGGTYSVTEAANKSFVLSASQVTVYLSTCWTNNTVAISTESWDYGDALGGTATQALVSTLEQFQTTAGGAWLNLPYGCNARQRDGGTLESVFHCFVNGSSINLYTSR
jgi:hypothetical protein